MVPVLGFVACTAILGAGVMAIDDARQGGTVKIGETFTYASGIALTVSQPKPFDANNALIVGSEEKAYEVVVTVTNGTENPVGSALIVSNATVNSTPAEAIYVDGLPTQDIAPGQQLAIPFRFKVDDATSGPLQIAVTDTFNKPVFFNGSL
jgi:hypothetical protein